MMKQKLSYTTGWLLIAVWRKKKLCNVASPLTNEKASLLKVGVARVKKAISNVVRWLDLK